MIGRPMARYSNTFVGEPKKGVPSGFLICGDNRMSPAASICGARSYGTIEVKTMFGASSPPLREAARCALALTGASQYQRRGCDQIGVSIEHASVRLDGWFDAVPRAEAAHQQRGSAALDAESLARPVPSIAG